ncbi:MAG: hypothetical protein K6D97_07460 [Clostridia bacterium]|nr:hypothetical protein [Clostridia bacterium]
MKEAVEDHRGSKKERPRNINCEKPIYINFLKAIANTEFLTMKFLHAL